MYQIEENNQEYPILIWVDSQILNLENQQYCEQLYNVYQNAFQAIDDISDALEILYKIGDNYVTILTSGQYAYQLVEHTKQNIIVFCGRKSNHLDLFIKNVQIKSIVSDSFESAHENAIMSMNQSDIQKEFIKLLLPPQQQATEYQHSKDHVSIQFLVVIEQLKKQKRPKEYKVFAEIEALLSKQNKQNKKYNIFQDLKKKEQEKLEITNQNFNLFEKLIYLYSREEIYSTFNQQFAQHNYQEIYQGFKENQNKNNYFKVLFRGISFDDQNNFEQIIRDLNSSKDERISLFWNTITSTSQSREIAHKFSSFSNYGILYKIKLDEDVPHPCFELQQYHSHYQNEKEVILFPQFEFIVKEIQFAQIQDQQIYIVNIKQVKNNYAFALDPMLRKIYWDSIIEGKIKPKIETLVNFQSKRIFELISFYTDSKYDYEIDLRPILQKIQNELENVFKQIETQLTKVFIHSNYPDVLIQIKNLTRTYIQFVKIEYQNKSVQNFYQLFEEHIDEVMKSLRQNICTLILKGVINIEQEKEYLQNLQQQFFMKQTKSSNIKILNTQNIEGLYFQKQPVYQDNTTVLSFQQLKAQKITSLQQVQHKNGHFAYEATLQDGNKLLMHHNPNNNNELTFTKKIDAQGKNGYSNKWQKVGKPTETKSVTVQDVQSSIKGQKNIKFDMKSIQAKEMNYQFQQAKVQGQIGGVIAGTVGSLTVDCIIDGVDEEKLGKGLLFSASVQGGVMYAQSVKSFGKAVPYVGMGLTALMASISIGGVLLSDFLSESEKVYNSMLIAVKTGGAIGLGYLGIEGGMALGAAAGPIGVVIGGIIGGFLGGATAIDDYTQFSMQVHFSKENKSIVKDGYLINPGKRPIIRWQCVKDKVRSLILIGQTETHLACLIPNIDRYKTVIYPDEVVGIKFNEYTYIGPDDSSQRITFRLLATTQDNIKNDEVLQLLQTKQINFIDIAEFEVNLKYIG
ncbi:unnamed protein product [Paramecium pentaurelia]|uniref:Uncharacterized protein n=1 Tax=Paramecium pentaurelia TaxID=43138 RepID=A0A8S1WQZ8_9CILI|nr:unnamed protein product [Paramecium pentaurelia]